jgi:hypothetical protein
MNIDEFCTRFGSHVRPIDAVAEEWNIAEIDRMLARLDHDFIGDATIVGDAIHGDGIRDQIPRQLGDAFRGLMKEKANSYREMRQILSERVRDSDGEILSFRDPRVIGFVNKLKGQIGENEFQRHVGSAARLASSGSQEGWDVVVTQSDRAHEYVQVKLYSNPNDVVRKMHEVHEKLSNGLIDGVDGETVEQISFAVPENIAGEVRQRIADKFPELIDMKLRTVPIAASAAADLVEQGLNNVGPGALEHLFDELLGGSVTAGSLHAIVNGFLWYRGAKDFSDACEDMIANTSLSAVGIGLGLLAETLTSAVPISAVIAIGGRAVLSRAARSRWNFADFLEESIRSSEVQVLELQRLA